MFLPFSFNSLATFVVQFTKSTYMRRKGLLLAIILTCWYQGIATTFDYNDRCKQAYDSILSLKLAKGQQLLDAEKKEHPNNNAPYFLEDYIDFFHIYLSGDKQVQKNLSGKLDSRLTRLRGADQNSPWYLYSQGEVLLHQAFAQVKFRDYGSALWNIRKAYKLLEQNCTAYPFFTPNDKSMGMLKAMLGIIPSKYQWGLSILGMEGDLNKGMEQLRRAANTDSYFKREGVVIYAMLLLHLQSKPQEAWAVVQANKLPVSGDLFSYFVAGNIALYSKHNADAVTILSTRPTGAQYEAFPYMDYLLGLAYLQQLDSRSDKYFQQFIAQNKGNDFVKSAYHKLAWSALINHRPDDYKTYLAKVKTLANTETDADKQAQKEAESGVVPDTFLLKGRLLFDGGYYGKALRALADKHTENATPEQQLELVYRKGRIYDEMHDDTSAMAAYRITIAKGRELPFFYAANAALQLGYIYERHGDKVNARRYFNECLNMKGSEYENSLASKAHAGLERVK